MKEGKELPKSHQCQQPARFPSERDFEDIRWHRACNLTHSSADSDGMR